jgi:hypothetical protein
VYSLTLAALQRLPEHENCTMDAYQAFKCDKRAIAMHWQAPAAAAAQLDRVQSYSEDEASALLSSCLLARSPIPLCCKNMFSAYIQRKRLIRAC